MGSAAKCALVRRFECRWWPVLTSPRPLIRRIAAYSRLDCVAAGSGGLFSYALRRISPPTPQDRRTRCSRVAETLAGQHVWWSSLRPVTPSVAGHPDKGLIERSSPLERAPCGETAGRLYPVGEPAEINRRREEPAPGDWYRGWPPLIQIGRRCDRWGAGHSAGVRTRLPCRRHPQFGRPSTRL